MSAAATSSGELRDVEVIAPAAEALGRFHAPANPFEEGAWPKAPANDEIADAVGDVKQSIDEFDLRRLLQQDSRVELVVSEHDRPSLPIRRVKGEPELLSQSLTPAGAGQTAGNAFGFHPVPAWDGHVPINDNWHPLEAA